mmetsp:Transcript_42900/g.127147  ORF Transcript_42900/g.127147 Transcript_42900/m.127147 type:complete len:897 (+) Transcript_42900:144-2834(+)
MDLRFYARDKESVRVYSYDSGTGAENGGLDEEQKAPFPLPPAKYSQWSPDGRHLATYDGQDGVKVATYAEGSDTATLQAISGAPKGTQGLMWSGLGGNLVITAPAVKGSQDPNVAIVSVGADGVFTTSFSFVHPKLERDKKVLQWSCDESYCARLLPDGNLVILAGGDVGGPVLVELKMDKPICGFEFASRGPKGNFKARIAVFVADSRDDLQRVVGPAEVTIFELVTSGASGPLMAQERAKAPLASGQMADLMWNYSGTALLAHSQTEVDESGQSYYGGSRLVLVSNDGEFVKDLTAAEEVNGGTGGSVQAVQWSPVRNEFILIHGFQPSKADLWDYNEGTKELKVAKVLLEKAHRNTVRFNPNGNLVCLAGFGNLAGQVDFFGRTDEEKCDFVRVSSFVANCTVHSEWAPDGRHFLTSVLAPRMRVDNGFSIWNALSGSRVGGLDVEELYDTQWRPEPSGSIRFMGVSTEEVVNASLELVKRGDAAGGQPQKQAYRPPKARGEGVSTGGASVAAMMRGEVAAPDADDRRNRKPRPIRAREEEIQGSPRPEVPPWGEQQERGDREVPQRRQTSMHEQEQDAPQRTHAPPPANRPPPPPEAVPAPPLAAAADIVRGKGQPQQPPVFPEDPRQTLAAAAAAAQREVQQQRQAAKQREQAEQAALEASRAAASAGAGGYSLGNRAALQAQAAARMAAEGMSAQARLEMQAQLLAGAARGGANKQAQAAQAQSLLAAQHAVQQHAAAQQAAAVAMQLQREEQHRAAREREQREQAERERHTAALAQRQAAQRSAAQAQAQAQAQLGAQQRQGHVQQGHGNKLPCPTAGWQYLDPKQNIQGPFTLLEMQQWNQMGYFRADLPMRCDPGDQFVPFADLFPHPLIPFQSYPKRPQRLGGAMR